MIQKGLRAWSWIMILIKDRDIGSWTIVLSISMDPDLVRKKEVLLGGGLPNLIGPYHN